MLDAMTCATSLSDASPEAPIATGACSRDDPQPKLLPPIMTGYSVFISPGSINLP